MTNRLNKRIDTKTDSNDQKTNLNSGAGYAWDKQFKLKTLFDLRVACFVRSSSLILGASDEIGSMNQGVVD